MSVIQECKVLSDKDLSGPRASSTFLEVAEKEASRIGLHISLVPKAREVIDNIKADTGVPQTEAIVRLLEWFASLDRKLRLAILNRDPDTREELVRLAFAGMLTKDADLPTLADLVRRVNDQLAQALAKPPKKLGHLPHPPPARESEPAPRTSKK